MQRKGICSCRYAPAGTMEVPDAAELLINDVLIAWAWGTSRKVTVRGNDYVCDVWHENEYRRGKVSLVYDSITTCATCT
jgi:hypothetical protein